MKRRRRTKYRRRRKFAGMPTLSQPRRGLKRTIEGIVTTALVAGAVINPLLLLAGAAEVAEVDVAASAGSLLGNRPYGNPNYNFPLFTY